MRNIVSKRALLAFFSLVILIWVVMACANDFKEINGLEEFFDEETPQEEEQTSSTNEDDTTAESSSSSSSILSGVFVDVAVAGVSYSTATQSGTTDSSGTFRYLSGETVSFSIGGIDLGETTGQSTITPLEVVGTTDGGDQRVVNMLRLLQTLDDDGNADNGIQITEAIRTQAAGQSLDFNQTQDAFETNTTSAISTLTSVRSALATTLITADQAITHFKGEVAALEIEVFSTPADITLSAASLAENQDSGTIVALLRTADLDPGDTHTYSLVSGSNDTDNASFSISSSSLVTSASFDYETQSSYSIRLRTTDSNGLTYELPFTITVTNVVPTDISLSASSVAENQSSGTTVGTLSSSDASTLDTFTLVSGTGDTDNASFSVDGTSLKTAASFDYETQSSYSIRLKVTDSSGATYEEAMTITVTDGNDTPTDISLSATSINENKSSGSTLATLGTTDEDSSDTHSYSLVSGTGDTNNSSFSISGSSLLTGASFDFETQSSYSIRLQTSDSGGATFTETVTITINNQNETPSDIALSASSIAENQSSGTTFGTLTTTDEDTSDSHTYSLVSGTGDTDNASFSVSGSSLLTAASFDYETKTSYAIRLRTTDSGGSTFEEAFTLTITDGNDTPTDIALSASTITENDVSGTTVGSLSSTDEDSGDSHTYSLVSGTGDTDNGSFSISGSSLLTATTFDYETATTSSILIRTTDSGGSTFDEAFTISTTNLIDQQQAYLKAPNAEADDDFGVSVATSGDTLVVGAYQEDSNQTTITNGTTASSDNSAGSSGAVYVFTRSGSTWTQEAYLKASNAGVGDWFGALVSISGDTLVVGADREDSNQTTITNGTTASSDNSANDSGAVYVFTRSGTTWTQEAYLKAPNAEAGDRFGYSVSISGDTLVVGAYLEASSQTTVTNGTTASSDNSASQAGAVYVFTRSGTTWTQEAYIKAPNAEASDIFGNSVSISGDTLVVGAVLEDSNQTTITNGTTASSDNSAANAGAVYVFKRNGTTWAQEAYLKAPNIESDDRFGYSVSISGDTLAVGANREDSNQTTITNGTTASSDNSAANAGAVYVFKRSGTTWTQEAYLKAPNAEASDGFGHSVSLSGDILVVGAPSEDSNQTTLTNGTTASSVNTASSAGAVYVFKRSGTTWAQKAYLKAPNAETNDVFGISVSISGETPVVGASSEDSNQTTLTNGTTASSDNSASDAGAVYVFE